MRQLLVRAVPRRLEGLERRLHWWQVEAGQIVARGHATPDALPAGLPMTVLLAAEDVVLTRALVPPLSGQRLREALPNLVEDMSLTDPANLHVAMSATPDAAGQRGLALVERAWSLALLERLGRAGGRVVAVWPEALCVPWRAGTWTLVREDGAADDGASGEPRQRTWVRNGPESAVALPGEAAAVQVALELMLAASIEADQPRSIEVFGDADDALGLAAILPAGLVRHAHSGVALEAWLAAGGMERGVGAAGGAGALSAPISLLQHDIAGLSGSRRAQRWRRAAAFAAVLVLVQLAGMQLYWKQLRDERGNLQSTMSAQLKGAFPEVTTVLDAPLQMAQSLARLRAATGRTDPGDFAAMAATAAQLFSGLPANSARGMDYVERTLRIRLAPEALGPGESQGALVAAAAAAGYGLQFETAQGQAGPETVAILRVKAAS